MSLSMQCICVNFPSFLRARSASISVLGARSLISVSIVLFKPVVAYSAFASHSTCAVPTLFVYPGKQTANPSVTGLRWV